MDPVPIMFYAAICRALAALVPVGLRGSARALIGAAVGIVAAVSLPLLRGAFGV